MANSTIKTSDLPHANTLVANDLIVVVYNVDANTGIANGQVTTGTITFSNLIPCIGQYIKGPFANDSVASSNVGINHLYYDNNGTIKIRLV